jgi:hypothetical protein
LKELTESKIKSSKKTLNLVPKMISNQLFYQKGKINVSNQHLKFAKPKSKSNMSQHTEVPGSNFSNSLAFSGGTTPMSPFQQTSSKNSTRIGQKHYDK